MAAPAVTVPLVTQSVDVPEPRMGMLLATLIEPPSTLILVAPFLPIWKLEPAPAVTEPPVPRMIHALGLRNSVFTGPVIAKLIVWSLELLLRIVLIPEPSVSVRALPLSV